MTSQQFEKVLNYLSAEQREKIKEIFLDFGLSSVNSFKLLPKNEQLKITSIVIPDEINFNRFGMEQKTKFYNSSTKTYELLNGIEAEYWEVYYEIMCSQNVSITYDNAEDEFIVYC